MPLSKRQITTLATAFTLAVGSGIMLMTTGQNGAEKSSPTPPTSAPRRDTGSIPATITKIIDKNVFEARAHIWVSQYVFTTVCVNAPKPPCTELAELNAGEEIEAGKIVHLSNIKPLAYEAPARDMPPPAVRPLQDRLPGPIPAHVTRLGDGDTVEVSAKIWPRQSVTTDIRFAKIDTPEKGGRAKCADEAALAKQASAETKRLLEDQDVLLYDIQFEKYGGRVLATIKTKDGTDASQNLVAKNLARPYAGKTKESWCRINPGK